MSEKTKTELESAAHAAYDEVLHPLLEMEPGLLTPAGREVVARLWSALCRCRIDRHMQRHYERADVAGLDDHTLRERILHKTGREIEDLVDAGLRHMSGARPEDFLAHWLRIGRAFGYATKDDSYGEFEKEFAILITRLVALERLVAGTPALREHASETLVPSLADSVVVRICRRAVELFGDEGDGMFTSATFGAAALELLKLKNLGGELAAVVLAGRPEIEALPGGCHFRLLAPPLAASVEEAVSVQ